MLKPMIIALALGICLPAVGNACMTSPGRSAELLSMINAERNRAGLARLQLDGNLTSAAQAHACDNAGRKSYAHEGSDGSDLLIRVKRAGYRLREAAENTFLGRSGAGAAVGYWMKSGYHRQNMLNAGYRDAGVGVAATGDGREAWVLVVGQGS
ncbi:MAG: CAP domain-containing protein [Gemmobacter sp.]|nr:CAP domain-containing protein [Gemmobacter sp.]